MSSPLALVAGPVHAVEEHNVLPAVGVVIQESATRAEGLGKQLAAVGATVVHKTNSRGVGYVGEAKS